jgi:nitroreductase
MHQYVPSTEYARDRAVANDEPSRGEVGSAAIVTCMETWDAIRARRNVRRFEDRAIDGADLDRILEAGRRAPSSKNWQPWDLVVVTDRAQLGELAKVWKSGGYLAGSAATVALVGPAVESEMQRDWLQFDNGQAMMSMMIAAADLGIGSGHSAVGDQELARTILGVPPDHFCIALLVLGYPLDRPLVPLQKPDRRPFDEVVHRGRW